MPLDVLLEVVEQLPVVPVTPDEVLGVCAADELLRHQCAFATFGVAFRIKNNAATEMVMPNIIIIMPNRVYSYAIKHEGLIKGSCKFILNIVSETFNFVF